MKQSDYELFSKALYNAIHWQNRCCELEEIIELFCLDAEANQFWPDWDMMKPLHERIKELEAERNFCPRCGKRLVGDGIHTCTPPDALSTNSKIQADT